MSIKVALRVKLLALSLIAASQVLAGAAEKTAFELVKDGNRYVGEQSKNKIVLVRSEKSIGTTEPNVWSIVYYDPLARNKAVEVKFGAGQMMGVKKGSKFFDFMSGTPRAMDLEDLKVDSNEAVRIALDQPLLKTIKISASRLKLQVLESGEPVWFVSLWAPKLRDSTKDAEVAETRINAKDGRIVETDIRLKRLD
jgi:hypothetical protein